MKDKELRTVFIQYLLWLALFLLLLSSFTSCTLPVKNYVVEKKVADTSSRSHKYMECVTRFNREGLKQNLIERLCNQALGGIE